MPLNSLTGNVALQLARTYAGETYRRALGYQSPEEFEPNLPNRRLSYTRLIGPTQGVHSKPALFRVEIDTSISHIGSQSIPLRRAFAMQSDLST